MSYNRMNWSLILFCGLVTSVWATDELPSLIDRSLEDLMNVNVVTSSKREEKFNHSPNVMTVITGADIKRMGKTTLYDVLSRVPGFFPTTQATWTLIGSRGMVSDGSDHILLLIDGHPQNTILDNGYRVQDTIPNLDRVARIEIIRGPGSVLWGTSAVFAIINVITKDTLGKDETRVNTGYQTGDGLRQATVTQSIQGEKVKGLISGTVWKSDGWDNQHHLPVKFAWGSDTNRWPSINQQYSSYDLYSKMTVNDKQTILMRVMDQSVVYPWDSWTYTYTGDASLRPGSEYRQRKAYLDYTYAKTFNEHVKTTFNVYGDQMEMTRSPREINTMKINGESRWVEDQSREESAMNGEVNTQITHERNILNLGAKYTYTKVGPNRGFRMDTNTNQPVQTIGSEQQVNYFDIQPGIDRSSALFAEDRYSVVKDRVDVLAGARADRNDWREKQTIFLPRGGALYYLNDKTTLKYMYNTGYLRPNAAYSKNGGKFYRSPSKSIETVSVVSQSEKTQSHDAQVLWIEGGKMLSLNAFYMEIDDYISWETKHDMGYHTMGDAISKGVEIEGKWPLPGHWVTLNGNYSFAQSKLAHVQDGRKCANGSGCTGATESLDGAITDDKHRWLNYPRHMGNIGADVMAFERYSLNLNARWWRNMRIVAPYDQPNKGQYETLTGEMVWDVSLLAQRLIWGLDANIYCHNIFNNTENVGLVINNGVYRPMGRNLGLELSANF